MTTVTVRRGGAPKRTEKQYGANEYCPGSVPVETGWERGPDVAISRIPQNNKMTVCRVRGKRGKGEAY